MQKVLSPWCKISQNQSKKSDREKLIVKEKIIGQACSILHQDFYDRLRSSKW